MKWYIFVAQGLHQFLFPTINKKFLIRLSIITIFSYIFFGHILTPFIIRGLSMEPTYHDGSINFCLKLRYLFSRPKRFDVVAIKLTDRRWLLKRIVALEGEEIEFRKGILFVNGKAIEEPYVKYRSNWDLSPRRVQSGYIYVVGDNREMPIENHIFGQTKIDRIIGSPIW